MWCEAAPNNSRTFRSYVITAGTLEIPRKVNGLWKSEISIEQLIINEEDYEDQVNNLVLIEVTDKLQAALQYVEIRKGIIALVSERNVGFVRWSYWLAAMKR